MYDGYLVHSRSDGGSALDTDTPVAPPLYAQIRTDLDVPVLQFVTETDLFGLPFIEARQPDSDHLRTWEVAGTAHLDRGMLDYRYAVAGLDAPPDPTRSSSGAGASTKDRRVRCCQAAFSALRRWVGAPPAEAPPIEVAGDAVARDELGIALGGIRTPAVGAPTVVLRGDNLTSTDYVCALFGSTAELDPAAFDARFPTDAAYDEAAQLARGRRRGRLPAGRRRSARRGTPVRRSAHLVPTSRGRRPDARRPDRSGVKACWKVDGRRRLVAEAAARRRPWPGESAARGR
ncbi:MAG: alpha/beta hydrolase domain-containing protein [Acidimicrobiales bacterium]